MQKILYRSPDGHITSNPQMDMVLDVIKNPKVCYWEAGSGGASIEYETPGCTSVLILFYSQPYGFFLEHRANVRKHDRYFSIGTEKMDELTTIYVSGEPHKLPTGVFVSKDSAQVAVQEFMGNGERSNCLQWKNRKEISWEDDSDEE